MALDSVAVFEKRVTELEVAELLPQIKVKGWTTRATFAYATSYQAGSPDDTRSSNRS